MEIVILRRNEAERNNALQYFFNAYSFGMHATKGRMSLPTSQSQTKKPISSNFLLPKKITLFFLSFCIFLHLSSFLSAIKNTCFYRFGPKVNFCTFSCVYLPEAPLASACIAHSLRHPLLDRISTSFSHD